MAPRQRSWSKPSPSGPVVHDAPSKSHLSTYSYDDEAKVLTVTFRTGETYRYAKVPAGVFAGLRAASSKGKFLHEHVRGKFEHEKVEEDKEQ